MLLHISIPIEEQYWAVVNDVVTMQYDGPGQ